MQQLCAAFAAFSLMGWMFPAGASNNRADFEGDAGVELQTERAVQDWIRDFAQEAKEKDRTLGKIHRYVPAGGSIPEDYLTRENFVDFREILKGIAPFGGNIVFDPSDVQLDDVFQADSFAVLPPHTQIRVHERCGKSAEPESWEYPVGARVAHRLSIRSSPLQLFELRLLEKREDGTWAFRIYAPKPGSHTLEEYLEDGPAFSFQTTLSTGRVIKVYMNRFASSESLSCRNCHRAVSQGRVHPPVDTKHAGPCGFIPANPAIYSEWRAKYKALHDGEDPFAFDCPVTKAVTSGSESAPKLP